METAAGVMDVRPCDDDFREAPCIFEPLVFHRTCLVVISALKADVQAASPSLNGSGYSSHMPYVSVDEIEEHQTLLHYLSARKSSPSIYRMAVSISYRPDHHHQQQRDYRRALIMNAAKAHQQDSSNPAILHDIGPLSDSSSITSDSTLGENYLIGSSDIYKASPSPGEPDNGKDSEAVPRTFQEGESQSSLLTYAQFVRRAEEDDAAFIQGHRSRMASASEPSDDSDSEHSSQSIRRLGIDEIVTAAKSRHRMQDNLVVLDNVYKYDCVGLDLTESEFSPEMAPGIYHSHHGLHFAWVSKHIDDYPRSGFFFFTKPCHNGSIRVLQWNKYNNTLGTHGVAVQEREIAASAFATYPRPKRPEPAPANDICRAQVWTMMTCCITPEVLTRVTGNTETDWRLRSTDPVRDRADEEWRISPKRRLSLAFHGCLLTFDFVKFTEMAFERASSKHQDTTLLLLDFIESHESLTTDDLVAEFQFLFVAGAIGSNTPCMELWFKMVIGVVLHSFSLVIERPLLVHDLIVTLGHQLLIDEYEDGCILTKNPEMGRGIREALITYKMRLTDMCLSDKCQSETHMAIAQAFSDIEEFFGLKFSDELRGHYINIKAENASKRSSSLADLAKSISWKRASPTGSSSEGHETAERIPAPVPLSAKRKSSRLFGWL